MRDERSLLGQIIRKGVLLGQIIRKVYSVRVDNKEGCILFG